MGQSWRRWHWWKASFCSSALTSHKRLGNSQGRPAPDDWGGKHLRSILYWLDFHGHDFWASFKASPWQDRSLRHDPLLYDTPRWTKLSVHNFPGREELTPLRTLVLKTPLRTSAQWLSEEEKNTILGNPC